MTAVGYAWRSYLSLRLSRTVATASGAALSAAWTQAAVTWQMVTMLMLGFICSCGTDAAGHAYSSGAGHGGHQVRHAGAVCAAHISSVQPAKNSGP